jgi:hypothetical protein
VRSGGVRGFRYRAVSLFRGTAHGADNIIGPSGQDVAPTGRPGISGAPSVSHCGLRNVSRLLAHDFRAGRLLDEDFCANLDAVVKVDHVSVIETKTS